MSEKKRLFKERHEDTEAEKPLKGRWFVYLTYIYVKMNLIILWITIILNAILIFYMLVDFNIGIMLFIFNQYIVVAYYMKLRKERQQDSKDQIEVI